MKLTVKALLDTLAGCDPDGVVTISIPDDHEEGIEYGCEVDEVQCLYSSEAHDKPGSKPDSIYLRVAPAHSRSSAVVDDQEDVSQPMLFCNKDVLVQASRDDTQVCFESGGVDYYFDRASIEGVTYTPNEAPNNQERGVLTVVGSGFEVTYFSATKVAADRIAEIARFPLASDVNTASTPMGPIVAAEFVCGVPINPMLPPGFDNTRNEERPASHRKFWNVPFIVTSSVADLDKYYAERTDAYADAGRKEWETNGRAQWMRAWPSGTRYETRCLDGGAWDRSTSWGMFASLEEAIDCASGPGWRAA